MSLNGWQNIKTSAKHLKRNWIIIIIIIGFSTAETCGQKEETTWLQWYNNALPLFNNLRHIYFINIRTIVIIFVCGMTWKGMGLCQDLLAYETLRMFERTLLISKKQVRRQGAHRSAPNDHTRSFSWRSWRRWLSQDMAVNEHYFFFLFCLNFCDDK